MSRIRNSVGKEIFHADTTFFADVTAEKHRLSLVVEDGVEGWVTGVIYPDTKESIMLAEFQSQEDAKRYLEDWARTVHRVAGSIQWIAGPPKEALVGFLRRHNPNAEN